MRKVHAIHGKDHLPDGPDPIPDWPTGGTSSAMWPGSYDLLQYDIFNMSGSDREAAPSWPGAVVRDTAYIKNYYAEASTDTAQFLSYMRLGPKGSQWCINLIADRGTDCGKLTFSWTTLDEATSASGNGYSDDGAGMVGGAGERGAATYYTTDTSTIDLYRNPAELHHDYAYVSPFRIGGDDGDMVTANSSLADADDNAKSFNGGAGIWVLKVLVDGKNASSSAYRTRIEGLWVRRLTSDLYSMA